MTQLEEIAIHIEESRRSLAQLINKSNGLVDIEILEASQNLDMQLNTYQKMAGADKKRF